MLRVLFKCVSPIISFHLEFPDSNVKIADVRGKIAESQGESFKADLLKLIYNGKTLQDDQMLGELKGIESKFIVVMQRKSEEIKKETTTTAKVGTATDKATAANDEVKTATETEVLDNPPPTTFEAVINHPGWQALQEMVQQDPYALPELVPQFLQGAPELMQAVDENRERFLQMLMGVQPPLATSSAPTTTAPAAVVTPSTTDAAPATAPVIAPAAAVNVPVATTAAPLFSEADREVMRRMMDMGFPESTVYEAFAVCDKNEEMAINYMLNMAAPDTGNKKDSGTSKDKKDGETSKEGEDKKDGETG